MDWIIRLHLVNKVWVMKLFIKSPFNRHIKSIRLILNYNDINEIWFVKIINIYSVFNRLKIFFRLTSGYKLKWGSSI